MGMSGPSSQSVGDGKPLKDPHAGWILRQIDTQPEPLIKLNRDENGQLLVSSLVERVAAAERNRLLMASIARRVVASMQPPPSGTSAFDHVELYRIACRVAGYKTAGVSVSIDGYHPRNLGWLYWQARDELGKRLGDVIDWDKSGVDGTSNDEAMTGTINFYLKGLTNQQASAVAAEVKKLEQKFRCYTSKVWIDTSKMFGVPTVRMAVTANDDAGMANLSSSSMTYTTWGHILEGLGLPADQESVQQGSARIQDFLGLAAKAHLFGKEQAFLQQVVDTATLALKNGYRELSWS